MGVSQTFQHFSSALFFGFNDMSEEIIACPKVLVFDFLGDEFLHGSSQLLMFLEVLADGIGLLVCVES